MRLILISSILLSTTLHSHAVTLGRHGGAAVIGRSLDVRVEALTGAGEDLAAACIRSEVFYGESQLSSSNVQVSPQRTAPDAKASIRVQTTVPVNEPVVTVVVSVGCNAPFSRRYVMLADPLTENNRVNTPLLVPERALGASRSSAAAIAGGGRNNGNRSSANANAGSSTSPGSGADTEPNDGEQAPPAPVRKSVSKPANRPARVSADAARPSVVRKPQPEVEPTGPRLHLDPVDVNLGIERDPVLKLSLALLSEPTASEEERAAAGLLWKAINASPEDVLRDSQKLAVLEAESKGLREQEAGDKAAIKAMQEQLDQTRYITWLAYLLGGLLLLSLAGLWFFRRRREESSVTKQAGAWWDGSQKAAAAAAAGVGLTAAAGTVKRREPSGLDLDLDLDLDATDSSFDEIESLNHDSSLAAVLSPSSSMRMDDNNFAGGSRSLATEELFDIQQQADFFISLGETDKAIAILRSHLQESKGSSALAYLDLFRLYHGQNKRQEYEELREEFNLKFNAGAPPFDQYTDSSVGLEGYETAFGRIQALWPQPRVLDVIEQSIFRDADDADGEVFDLEAYRELLLLHAVAKEMIHEDEMEHVPQVDFEHTKIKPLKAAGAASTLDFSAREFDRAGPKTEPHDVLAPVSSRLGLDVDLDALSEMSAFEASLPEVPEVVEATAVSQERLAASVADEGNLIDFEVMDFLPPEDPEKAKKPSKKD